MASGPCAAPTGRRHGRTDQPSQNSKINLANGEPSRHGANLTLTLIGERQIAYFNPSMNVFISVVTWSVLDAKTAC